MNVWIALLIGTIYGITAILPVSDTGHFAFIVDILKLDYVQSDNLLFHVFLRIAIFLALLLSYKKEVALLFRDSAVLISDLRKPEKSRRKITTLGRFAVMLVISSVPLLIIMILNKVLENAYSNMTFVSILMIVTGIFIFVTNRFARGDKNEKDMTLKDSILIGIANAVAFVPGFSRVGLTTGTGELLGLNKRFALKYSLFLYIPYAIVINLINFLGAVRYTINWARVPIYLIGFVVAFFFAFVSINLIRKLIDNGKYYKVSYYTCFIGVLSLILSLTLK